MASKYVYRVEIIVLCNYLDVRIREKKGVNYDNVHDLDLGNWMMPFSVMRERKGPFEVECGESR